MPLDFPASPTNGQVYTSGGSSWTFDSSIGTWRSSPFEPGAAITSSTAPTNPQNGDIWYDTDDGTTFVYYNDGNTAQWVEIRSQIATSQVGLVPIVPSSVVVGSGTGSADASGLVTFSGVSSVSLNNVFSSAFRNYRFVITTPVASATTALGIRFRTAGVDNSTLTYFQYVLYSRLSGVTQTNSGGAVTFLTVYPMTTSSGSFFNFSADIFNPNLSTAPTNYNGLAMGNDATSSMALWGAGLFNANTVFDGITFLATSGGTTMSGTVKIYGYN